MKPRILMVGLLAALVSFSACRDARTVVVYADPYLEDFLAEHIPAFESEYGLSVELKTLSSEVIAKHIQFGQPVDVFLASWPEIPASYGVGDKIAAAQPLASDRIAYVRCTATETQANFRSENCRVLPAGGTPVRAYAENCFPQRDSNQCLVFADFYWQMRDYLARGWVAGGYTFASLAQRLPGVEIRTLCDTLPGVFTAFRLQGGRNPQGAEKFMESLSTEKTRSLLERKHFIP